MAEEPITPKAKGSTYVVLCFHARPQSTRPDASSTDTVLIGELWEHCGSFAGSAAQAMKQAAEKRREDLQTGRYVAIPVRSFQPRKLTAKTETRVTLT
jgi:hypothetical protein